VRAHVKGSFELLSGERQKGLLPALKKRSWVEAGLSVSHALSEAQMQVCLGTALENKHNNVGTGVGKVLKTANC